jgi:Ca2+-binding EF-hand superfamily protein
VLLGRIRRALAVRRQNWLQVFASFDHVGDGKLPEAEFDRAVTSMALGLSDTEIREVRQYLLLQSGGNCVPVDLFGKALHGTCLEVQRAEAWGRTTMQELSREAAKTAGGTKGVGPGAAVRVQGLQSAVGVKLNGSEGVVDKWDASNCRWVVRLPHGELKSIRDEHLHVLRPAPSSGGPVEDTTAVYRLLCEGGESGAETAVPEANFLSAAKGLLPKMTDAEWRRLLLLLPKSADGRVDVDEVLTHFLVGGSLSDQTLQMGGPLFPPAGGAAQVFPGPNFQPTASPSRAPGQLPQGRANAAPQTTPPHRGPQPNLVPGSVQSPRSPVLPPRGDNFGHNAERGQVSASERAHAEVALLRLAQKLMGRPAAPGPGVDLLRLFAAQPDEVRLEELFEAVSVSPLGISRAEVQVVFSHLTADASETLSFAILSTAIDTAFKAGTPAEAAVLDGVNLARLNAALQRLDSAGGGSGRATVQEFRVTLMQAEPYLTANQLEWLLALTDKDGEGRLLPRSLLVRLGAGPANPGRGGSLMVPQRPASTLRAPIAPHTPRSQVVASILARIRDRLYSAGAQLTIERILSIFEIGNERGASTSRETLACLLGHMRLGISVAEADELVSSIAGGSTVGGGAASVLLSSLYDAVRATEPEQDMLVDELREGVREKFLGRGSQFADAALKLCGPRTEGGDWLPESEFRWCLAQALVDEGIQATPMDPDEEDRALLLVEKSAAGPVRWRQFASTHLGWHDDDYYSDPGLVSPKPRGGAPCQLAPSTTQQTWHQTWRSGKTVPERNVFVASPEKQSYMSAKEVPGAPSKMQTEPPPKQGGACRCLARLFGGGGKSMQA